MPRRKGDRTRDRLQQPEGRANIWAAIRFIRRFTLEEIEQASHEDYANIRKYVARLHAAGYLRLVDKSNGTGKTNSYQLIKNTGPLPPIPQFEAACVYDPNNGCTYSETTLPTDRDLAWTWMRQQLEFTSFDLQRAGMSRPNALKYLAGLEKAGYVKVIQPKVTGPKGTPAVYCLVINSGPQAPMVQRDGSVSDPNLLEVAL